MLSAVKAQYQPCCTYEKTSGSGGSRSFTGINIACCACSNMHSAVIVDVPPASKPAYPCEEAVFMHALPSVQPILSG